MSQEIKRLIECTGDGHNMRDIIGVYDVATMKSEDLAKQRARHNREFVYAEDYDRLASERDALARRVREEWAFNHGCPIGAIYGDDGELQCNRCGIDFRRTDLEELSRLVTFARAVAAGAEVRPAPPDAGGPTR